MKTRHEHPAAFDRVPLAKVAQKQKIAVIWIVPIIAGLIAAWLVYVNLLHSGPAITIQFADGSGLQPGRTLIRYRGVQIGQVDSVDLSGDNHAVQVAAHLERSAASFARDGATFWVVRADVSAGGLHGLDTIVGGPYIQGEPGTGLKKKKFIGLEQGPVVAVRDSGLDLTLTWPELGWMNPGAPVYYRGVQVGIVQDYRLGDQATNILIHVHFQPQYSALVRQDSKFWNAGGIAADISLIHGVSVSAESLKALLMGGIAFATPTPPGPRAAPNSIFPLNEKPEEKWLKWSPAIELGSQTNAPPLSPNESGDRVSPAAGSASPGS